jgi:hypothetical protein
LKFVPGDKLGVFDASLSISSNLVEPGINLNKGFMKIEEDIKVSSP